MSDYEVRIMELYDGTLQVQFFKEGKIDHYERCFDWDAVRFVLTEYFDG